MFFIRFHGFDILGFFSLTLRLPAFYSPMRSHLSNSPRKDFSLFRPAHTFLWVTCACGSVCASDYSSFFTPAPVNMCPPGLVGYFLFLIVISNKYFK